MSLLRALSHQMRKFICEINDSNLSILTLRPVTSFLSVPFLSCSQRGGGVAVHQEPPGEAHAATEGRGSLRADPQQRGR